MEFTHPATRPDTYFKLGDEVIVFVADSERRGGLIKQLVPGHFFRGKVRTMYKDGVLDFVLQKRVFDGPYGYVSGCYDSHQPFVLTQEEFDTIHTQPELRAKWVESPADLFPDQVKIKEFLAALNQPNDVGTFNQVFTI